MFGSDSIAVPLERGAQGRAISGFDGNDDGLRRSACAESLAHAAIDLWIASLRECLDREQQREECAEGSQWESARGHSDAFHSKATAKAQLGKVWARKLLIFGDLHADTGL